MQSLAVAAVSEREHAEKELAALREKAKEQNVRQEALNTRNGTMIAELTSHVAEIDTLLRRKAYLDTVSRVQSIMFVSFNNLKHEYDVYLMTTTTVPSLTCVLAVRRCSMLQHHRQ